MDKFNEKLKGIKAYRLLHMAYDSFCRLCSLSRCSLAYRRRVHCV